MSFSLVGSLLGGIVPPIYGISLLFPAGNFVEQDMLSALLLIVWGYFWGSAFGLAAGAISGLLVCAVVWILFVVVPHRSKVPLLCVIAGSGCGVWLAAVSLPAFLMVPGFFFFSSVGAVFGFLIGTVLVYDK